MRNHSMLTAGLIGLGLWAVSAQAQFQAPAGAQQYEDTGTFEAAQDSVIKIHDSKKDEWWLQTMDGTKLTVAGEADHDYVRTGAIVEFTAEIDRKGILQNDPESIVIMDVSDKPPLGLFPAGEAEAEIAHDAKPLRALTAGTFRIRARVITNKEGRVILMAGKNKVMGEIGEDVPVKVKSDNVGIAQNGDEVKVKAWYYDNGRPIAALNRPGKGIAEEVTITLAKPLAYSGKKSKPSAKPAAKSSRVSK